MNDLARAVAMIIGPSMLLAVLVYLRVNTSEFDRYPYYLVFDGRNHLHLYRRTRDENGPSSVRLLIIVTTGMFLTY
jgi:hypothetical protein